jgi:hypothetical protein
MASTVAVAVAVEWMAWAVAVAIQWMAWAVAVAVEWMAWAAFLTPWLERCMEAYLVARVPYQEEGRQEACQCRVCQCKVPLWEVKGV